MSCTIENCSYRPLTIKRCLKTLSHTNEKAKFSNAHFLVYLWSWRQKLKLRTCFLSSHVLAVVWSCILIYYWALCKNLVPRTVELLLPDHASPTTFSKGYKIYMSEEVILRDRNWTLALLNLGFVVTPSKERLRDQMGGYIPY